MFSFTFSFTAEPVEPPPKTYTTKDKFEYFKPCIQVDMDHPDKGETVTDIYIRGEKQSQISVYIYMYFFTVSTFIILQTINYDLH